MKKLNKVAVLFASVALAAPVASIAQSGTAAKSIDNWRATDGTVWKNGTNELCWRNSNWTPATADAKCDGALKPPAPVPPVAPTPTPPPPPAPAVVPPPAPAPAPVAPPAPVSEKVSFSADAFFDFDKAVLKPEGRDKLTTLAQQAKTVNLEVIIAIGHTDSIGSEAYNQALSVRRAEAVKDFLVSQGIERNRIYTEGKGESSPVADNRTRDGRAQNRRVVVEVVGTRNK